jgi:hypothetical protein
MGDPNWRANGARQEAIGDAMSTENETKTAPTETPKTPQWKRKTQGGIAIEMAMRHNGTILECISDVDELRHTIYGKHDDGNDNKEWGVLEMLTEVGKRLRTLDAKVAALEAKFASTTEPEPTKEPTT